MSHILRSTRSQLRRGLFVLPVVALTATQALAAGGLVSATASGNDGNVPANAIDGSLATRWSNLGVGSWLRADMGQAKTLKAVDIAWYNGSSRSSRFTLSTSMDGTTFTQVFSGASSGTTSSYERYTFPAVTARYVKVTVNGNTQNTWASISEMTVTADTISTGGTTTDTGTGATTAPTTDVDAFGL